MIQGHPAAVDYLVSYSSSST